MCKVFPLFARSIALRLKGRQNSWFFIEDFQVQGLDTLVLKKIIILPLAAEEQLRFDISFYLFNYRLSIGVYLLHNVVLVYAVEQSESVLCMHVCPPSRAFLSASPQPLRAITEHRAGLPGCAAGSRSLSVSHMVLCIRHRYSPGCPLSPSPSCPHVLSLCLHLYSCPENRFICSGPFF